MKIKSIHIENFRSFKDQSIEFGNYNCLVGPNGAGKSTVLNALNVFFRESNSSPVDLLELGKEDFHCSDTSKPVRITVTFTDLPEKARTELKDYVRQQQLTVSAVAAWSEETQTAPVVQRGQRRAMKEFSPFFVAIGDSKPVAELKSIYSEIRKTFPELPTPSTKTAMTDALRTYEETRPELCVLLESDDEFYGASKGAHKLGEFIQWIFVPAVKEATDEQIDSKDTALSRLVERTALSKMNFSEKVKELRERTNNEYDKLLAANQNSLDQLSGALKKRLVKWAHPNAELAVKWDKDPAKTVRVEEPFAKVLVGECGFFGDLGRLGHGFQRSFLLALLEELAAGDSEQAPCLLLGIEEPELFQHPPQAQYLGEVLQILSEGNAQVFACTHSPYFVVGKGFEDVRLIRKPAGSPIANVSQLTFQKLADQLTLMLEEPRFKRPEGVRAKINQALQSALREMFFAPTLVLVEGLEDVAYLQSGLMLSGLWESWRATSAHIVPVNGKSELVQPLAIAQLMKIPTFTVFDADGNAKPGQKGMHAKDNERLFRLLNVKEQNPFPESTVWGESFVVWPQNFGVSVATDYQHDDWLKWKTMTEAELGQPGGLEKNSLLIAGILSKAWAEGIPSATLVQICKSIIAFAEKARA